MNTVVIPSSAAVVRVEDHAPAPRSYTSEVLRRFRSDPAGLLALGALIAIVVAAVAARY